MGVRKKGSEKELARENIREMHIKAKTKKSEVKLKP